MVILTGKATSFVFHMIEDVHMDPVETDYSSLLQIGRLQWHLTDTLATPTAAAKGISQQRERRVVDRGLDSLETVFGTI